MLFSNVPTHYYTYYQVWGYRSTSFKALRIAFYGSITLSTEKVPWEESKKSPRQQKTWNVILLFVVSFQKTLLLYLNEVEPVILSLRKQGNNSVNVLLVEPTFVWALYSKLFKNLYLFIKDERIAIKKDYYLLETCLYRFYLIRM